MMSRMTRKFHGRRIAMVSGAPIRFNIERVHSLVENTRILLELLEQERLQEARFRLDTYAHEDQSTLEELYSEMAAA